QSRRKCRPSTRRSVVATTRPSGAAITAASSPGPSSTAGDGGSRRVSRAINPNSPASPIVPISRHSCCSSGRARHGRRTRSPGRPPGRVTRYGEPSDRQFSARGGRDGAGLHPHPDRSGQGRRRGRAHLRHTWREAGGGRHGPLRRDRPGGGTQRRRAGQARGRADPGGRRQHPHPHLPDRPRLRRLSTAKTLSRSKMDTSKAKASKGKASRAKAFLVAGAALVTAACGGAVQVPVPEADAATKRLCQGLRLPAKVHGEERRDTTPESPLTAPWGSPALAPRCGVPRPAALQPTSQLVTINGIHWFGHPAGRPVTFTAVGRQAYVEVTVPPKYEPAGDVLIELGPSIKATIPEKPEGQI